VGCGSNAPSTLPVMTGAAGTGAAGTAAPVTGGAGTGAAGTGPATGAAGTGSATGAAGTGSATGAAGMSGGGDTFTPLCSLVPLTEAGVAPTKGGACTAKDTQLCYKTCGPQSVGFKSETCTNGTYVEQSGCSFPKATDYSCYKVPAAVDASCPATAPQASQPCTVKACTLCNVGGNYLDSTGASKVGYCVCPAAGASGTSKWSCASMTAWPCPSGQGCM
jgi:hypothetical protein